MFYYLNGTVAHKETNLAVIDCDGVGYACHTSMTTSASIKEGQNAKLFTYLHIREDIMDLYGFATHEELSCFKLLISVSGVGPKAALAILSAISPAELAMAIITQNEKAFTSAQGVGKKIAQRIVIELKDKMTKTQLEYSVSTPDIAVQPEGAAGEAISALQVLGYSAAEASAALKGADPLLSADMMIKYALKNLAKI